MNLDRIVRRVERPRNRRVQGHRVPGNSGNRPCVSKGKLAIGAGDRIRPAAEGRPRPAGMRGGKRRPKILAHHHFLPDGKLRGRVHLHAERSFRNHSRHVGQHVAAVDPSLVPAAQAFSESKKPLIAVIHGVVRRRHQQGRGAASRSFDRQVASHDTDTGTDRVRACGNFEYAAASGKKSVNFTLQLCGDVPRARNGLDIARNTRRERDFAQAVTGVGIIEQAPTAPVEVHGLLLVFPRPGIPRKKLRFPRFRGKRKRNRQPRKKPAGFFQKSHRHFKFN